jgi:predicted TIM-barrel fold metal-dependent hydrolase
MRIVAGLALQLLALIGTSAGAAPATNPAPAFVPLVDYHQHLASPAGVALLNRSPRPVSLPEDISGLLDQLARHWNDSAALADLYTDDATVFANIKSPLDPWLHGRKAAANYIGSLYGRPYSMTPIVFASSGRRAHLAGFFSRGERGSEQHFGYFDFELLQGTDSRWRIAVDNRNFEPKPFYQPAISGRVLLNLLDEAGVRQAVVLSDAYWFDAPTYRSPGQTIEEMYPLVRAENDWTARESAASGGRLVAFCSFNPLASYALRELRRCKSSGAIVGLKLHLQMSEVDLHSAMDVGRLQQVFAEADRLGLAIVVHAQTAGNYDAAAARALITQVIPAAQHVPVTIAHLWGGGPLAAAPLEVYVSAVQRHAKGTQNLYFDVAEVALVANGNKEMLQTIADAIRRIGPTHILFGSDAVGQNTLPPAKAIAQFRSDVPLTDAEFAIIAANHLPYLPPVR